MTRPLDEIIKMAFLNAIIEADFDLKLAAALLEVSKMTVLRQLERWKIETPLAGQHPGTVKYSDYLKRCDRIRMILKDLSGTEVSLPGVPR